MSDKQKRYVGLDVHKHYVMVGAVNRLRSLLQRHHLVPPEGDLFSAAQRNWWNKLELNSSEKLRARQDLIILDQLAPLISEVETEIERLSVTEPWAEQTPYVRYRSDHGDDHPGRDWRD